jgi:pyruvate dehydrogenase E2 component (dihydrolipoamide acetyltransferase)
VTVSERTLVDWTPIRRAVAKRMSAANRDIPQFHVTSRIDVEAAQRGLQELSARSGTRITLTTVLLAATARALRAHPRLNSVWDGEELYSSHAINVGVAIALEGGLVAPAILDADALDLPELAEQLRDLVERARNGGLRSAELTAATFTLSNLGMFEVANFAAIVTPPQVAILATGSVLSTQSWNGSQWTSSNYIEATLSCDHRALDGADAARFLQSLRRELESPPSTTTEVRT